MYFYKISLLLWIVVKYYTIYVHSSLNISGLPTTVKKDTTLICFVKTKERIFKIFYVNLPNRCYEHFSLPRWQANIPHANV